MLVACLESMIKKLWERMRVNLNKEYLNHLKCENDIVLKSESLDKLELMLNRLNKERIKTGLKMNRNKTNAICNCNITKTVLKIED